MHWYTLTPDNGIRLSTLQGLMHQPQNWVNHHVPPIGHEIVRALQDLLQEHRIVTLQGPFFCYLETLYFPCPLNYSGTEKLIPLPWLQEQSCSTPEPPLHARMLWDRRKPAPLLQASGTEQTDPLNSYSSTKRQFLPYHVILKLLRNGSLAPDDFQCETGEHPQPWTINLQMVNAVNQAGLIDRSSFYIEQTIRLRSGWRFAIAIDDATHEQLKKRGSLFLIELGCERHQYWLESYHESFQQQWQTLQKESKRNRKTAEQQLQKNARQARILAYLITPGLFERKTSGMALCRAFPWEWNLAQTESSASQRIPLVSLATTSPVPIHCPTLSKSAPDNKSADLQIFAVPAGSVYYLEYPKSLFQDQPKLKDGNVNKIHMWRQLGYSELMWLPY